MEDKTLITLWIATLLTILEVVAIFCNLDGKFFLPMVAAICLVAGYKIQGLRSS